MEEVGRTFKCTVRQSKWKRGNVDHVSVWVEDRIPARDVDYKVCSSEARSRLGLHVINFSV